MRVGSDGTWRARLAALARLWFIMAAITAPADATAGSTAVDLELVIAVDVSTSMDGWERRLQQDGFAAAFRHPSVVDAIESGPLGRIAVTYMEWGGERGQRVVIPWTLVDGRASAGAFADRLSARLPGRIGLGTAIGDALDTARHLMATSGLAGTRRVVNLSGDGVSNRGGDLHRARAAILRDGVTVNVLAIVHGGRLHAGSVVAGLGTTGGEPDMPPALLTRYFEEHVIGGPGAFVEPVAAPGDFADAIRRKLVREIAAPGPVARLSAREPAAGT
jgi:hypothetical protein